MPRHKLTEEQIAQIKDVYNYYKDPKVGKVRREQLVDVFRALGQVLSAKEVGLMDKEMEFKGGYFQLLDLLCVMTRRFWDSTSRERLLEAFRNLDKEKSGLISIYELRRLVTTTGDKMTDEQFDEVIKDTSASASEGLINYTELVDSLLRY